MDDEWEYTTEEWVEMCRRRATARILRLPTYLDDHRRLRLPVRADDLDGDGDRQQRRLAGAIRRSDRGTLRYRGRTGRYRTHPPVTFPKHLGEYIRYSSR